MRFLRGYAGPLLIVAGVIAALHTTVLQGITSPGNADVHGFFFPNHCFLGTSLRAGTIPGWNPYQMGGIPFAADPQSGWMYLPAMVLYTALPCERALPLFLALQPMLAGLGLWAFLRAERLSETAATVGGLALGLGIAGTSLTIAPSFSGTLAWTAVTLACTARLLHAPAGWRPIGWTVAAAVAWGQVAAAHLSHGFLLGTLTVATYASVCLMRGDRTRVLARMGLLLVALVGVNLAFFLPRLGYLPRTSLVLGYDELRALGAHAPGEDLSDLPGPAWPFSFVTSPGIYMGAVVLVSLLLGCIRRGPRRSLAVAFIGLSGLLWLIGSAFFADAVRETVRDLPFGDFYLRAPLRFAYGLPLCFAVAAAVGIDGLLERRSRLPHPGLLAAAALAWPVAALAARAHPSHLWLFVVGSGAAAIAIVLARSRPALVLLLPLVVGAELVTNSLIGQTDDSFRTDGVVTTEAIVWRYHQLLRPSFNAAEYATDPVLEELGERPGRTMTLDPFIAQLSRPMLFELEELHGYNPVQLQRYWHLVRHMNTQRLRYYTGAFLDPDERVLDLYDVTSAVGRADLKQELVVRAHERVAKRDDRGLFLEGGPGRATVHDNWSVTTAAGSRDAVVAGIPPDGPVVLEEDPGIPPARGRHRKGNQPSSARFSWRGTQAATVSVASEDPGVLLIRNTFDPGWEATVNGEPAPLLVANHLLQAVAVPGGRSEVELTYRDPWVSRGLGGSALALVVLLLTGLAWGRASSGRGPVTQRGDN